VAVLTIEILECVLSQNRVALGVGDEDTEGILLECVLLLECVRWIPGLPRRNRCWRRAHRRHQRRPGQNPVEREHILIREHLLTQAYQRRPSQTLCVCMCVIVIHIHTHTIDYT